MKVKQNITVAAMALSLVAGVALATAADMNTTDVQRGTGFGMMSGQGSHHGTTRGERGCGHKAMMKTNQDCGMANCGQRMGRKGMMGGGPGMHHGAVMNPEIREKRNQFLDSTVELRKQINDKRFVYMEAQRNPDLTQGELQKQADELFALRQQLQAKRQAILETETKE